MSKEFKRRDYKRYSKIGKNRKKIQTWRRPKGRDNKMRLRFHGYPRRPTVGHRSAKAESGLIDGKVAYLVHNISELERVDKKGIVIMAKVGAKKKLEIMKKAQEMKIEIYNLAKETKK
jgi:large subunit ribosomal protein L32e